MDIFSLSILLLALSLSDEFLNGKLRVSGKLVEWLQGQPTSTSKTQNLRKIKQRV